MSTGLDTSAPIAPVKINVIVERSSSPSLILTNNSNVLNKKSAQQLDPSTTVEPCCSTMTMTRHHLLLKSIRDPTVINLITTDSKPQQQMSARLLRPADSSTTTSTTTSSQPSSTSGGDLAGFQLLVDVAVRELHRIQQGNGNSNGNLALLCNWNLPCVFLQTFLCHEKKKSAICFLFVLCVNSMSLFSVHARWKACCPHLPLLWSTLFFPLLSFSVVVVVHFSSSFSDHFLCSFFLLLFFLEEVLFLFVWFFSLFFSLRSGSFASSFFHTWCFSSFIRWGINQKEKKSNNIQDVCMDVKISVCIRAGFLWNLASLLSHIRWRMWFVLCSTDNAFVSI